MDIRKIAEKAGVSVATVSRVQNHPETVAPATREKVQAVIDEFQYVPNWFARGMNLGKAYTVGIIVPDILNPSYMEIVKGIEDIMSENGYTNIICDSSSNSKKEGERIDNLLKRNVDGLIILSSCMEREKLLSIKSKGVPIVSIGESNGGKEIDTVKIDYKKASYKATKHLMDIGHDKIAIINGPKEKRENQLRLEGFKEALKNSNIKVEKDYIIHAKIALDEGYFQAKKLIKLKNPPRAIFATDDIFAIGVLSALRDNNIRVPQDVAVVGFDNIQFARMIESKLTTVINPLHKQGVLGARLLVDIIENRENEESFTQEILLETKLKIRKTCGYEKRLGEIF